MSDHPVAGGGIGALEGEVEADRGPEGADAVLDVGGAHAVAIAGAVDDLGRDDAAGGGFARGDVAAVFADVDRVFNVQRPALAVPPGHGARFQVIPRQDLHFTASSAISRSSNSLRAATSPMTMSAGLFTLFFATSAARPASGPRRTRIAGRVAFSMTATGTSGARPSAISFSEIASAVATPM